MPRLPYKGNAPALSDTLVGLAQFMFPSLFVALPHVRSGKLRALGVSGVDVTQRYALFAPARTPRPLVDQLNRALKAALADPALVQGLEDHGAEVRRSTPELLARLVQDKLAKWQGVVQAARLTAE